jgi:ABC-type amino acid transport substrate-binding protein
MMGVWVACQDSADSEVVMRYLLKTLQLTDQLKIFNEDMEYEQQHQELPPDYIWATIAFSPQEPQRAELAQMIDDGLATLYQSGELAQIMQKYGLEGSREGTFYE